VLAAEVREGQRVEPQAEEALLHDAGRMQLEHRVRSPLADDLREEGVQRQRGRHRPAQWMGRPREANAQGAHHPRLQSRRAERALDEMADRGLPLRARHPDQRQPLVGIAEHPRARARERAVGVVDERVRHVRGKRLRFLVAGLEDHEPRSVLQSLGRGDPRLRRPQLEEDLPFPQLARRNRDRRQVDAGTGAHDGAGKELTQWQHRSVSPPLPCHKRAG
jgi:hypothetical protein